MAPTGGPSYGSLGDPGGSRILSVGAQDQENVGPGGEVARGSRRQRRKEAVDERVTYSKLPVLLGALFSIASVILLASARRSEVGEAMYSTYAAFVSYQNDNAYGMGDISASSTPNGVIGEYDNVGTVVDVTSQVSSGISFSFSRDGYAAVNLHNDFFVYQILNDYDTVIEPYVPMSLLVVGGDSSAYYKYSVCSVDSDKTDRSCQYGTLSTDPMSKVTSSGITVECDPFDELEIEITQYDSTDNSEMATQAGDALCMYVLT